MPYSRRRTAPPQASPRGFTLIELLVVIAIIAILTAILLPVFAVVQENARQSSSISNLKDIQQKMEQYKLDNHQYPAVLFGYAITGANGYAANGTSIKNALAAAQAYDTAHAGSHQAATAFSGLYPAYIKDYNEFVDQNNPIGPEVSDATAVVGPFNVNAPGGSGSAASNQKYFFAADAYDTSPSVGSASNTVGANVLRYQLLWTNCVTANGQYDSTSTAACTASPPTAATQDDYTHQLLWKSPPADTYVTAASAHVQNADKVLVLFDSGAVKKVKAEDFNRFGDSDTPPTSWKYTQRLGSGGG